MNNQIKIGFLGRFSHQKGADILIDAIKLLKDKNINAQLFLAGDGELKSEYLKLIRDYNISENITFLGWIKDKKTFFDLIDIFCLSSRDEGFGLVLLEAMKYKKPIITTDCDGPKDIFINGTDAIIVKKESAEELATAISELKNNINLQNTLAENAYIKFCNNYTEDNFLTKLQSVLEYLQITKDKNILNICYHNKVGGLENIFIEYSYNLSKMGYSTTSFITNNAKFKQSLVERGQKIIENRFLRNRFTGFLLYLKLKRIIKDKKIDLIICHGERNLKYIKMAKSRAKLLLVNHGTETKSSENVDYIMTVNSEIKRKIIESGYSKNQVSVIGNFLYKNI